MVTSARRTLADARSDAISTDSRFALAAEAAHKFALAALRLQGYRSENRITVFQALVHTVPIDRGDLQIFLRAHSERNLASYEGHLDISEKLLVDLLGAAGRLEAAVGQLRAPAS